MVWYGWKLVCRLIDIMISQWNFTKRTRIVYFYTIIIKWSRAHLNAQVFADPIMIVSTSPTTIFNYQYNMLRARIKILTYEIIGRFLDCAIMASVLQWPSGPKKATTPAQLMSVISRVDVTVSNLVSCHSNSILTFGNRDGSLLSWNTNLYTLQNCIHF